jgi:isochorismate synthase EntC
MLLMSNLSLYQRFFDAAKLDLQAAKALKDKQLYQPVIYHFQQAYEKCIKSYYILKEVKLKNTPEATAYDHVIHLGHDTEESTMKLLKDMVTIEQDGYKKVLPNLSDQQQIQAVKKVIAAIDSYKSSLDRSVQTLNLSNNYIKYVRDYSNYITSRYNVHQNFINTAIVFIRQFRPAR